MKVLGIVGSPRRDGNTNILVEEILRGTCDKHHASTERIYLDDYISDPIRDCKLCRNKEGNCTIDDRYEELIFKVLGNEYLIIGSPLYWYGPSGQLKIFFDRWFCYVSDSYPNSNQVINEMKGKKVVLCIACEESWPGLTNNLIGMVSQTLEYMGMVLLAVVIGDNAGPRGEILKNERVMMDAYWIGSNIDRLQCGRMTIESRRRLSSLE